MGRALRGSGPKLWMACGLAAWLAAFATVQAQTTPRAAVPAPEDESSAVGDIPQPQAAQQSGAQSGATYVGQDACLTCHDDPKYDNKGTPHARAADPRTPAAKQGCESCHGPGSLHMEDPQANHVRIFPKVSADEVNDTCTSCHNRGEHALWDGSAHQSRDLSCVTCHSVHSPKSETGQLKARGQADLCATCHRDKVAKLDRSGHMPVREGKMQCSTCHNTHGSTNTKMLRTGDSIAELCTSCHADKRGPYLWEHAPSRDGCVTCHDPHGSSNERMLVTRLPILCQRCHVATRHPSTIYDEALINTSARTYARSCVTCHAAIHGSNHPSGQRFIR